jgi:hypothetical protein
MPARRPLLEAFARERLLQERTASSSGNEVSLGRFRGRPAVLKLTPEPPRRPLLRLLGQMAGVPSVARLLAWQRLPASAAPMRAAYVYEYKSGEALDEWRGPPERAAQLYCHIVASLADLRRAVPGFCLRDLHPGNILVGPDLAVAWVDLDMAVAGRRACRRRAFDTPLRLLRFVGQRLSHEVAAKAALGYFALRFYPHRRRRSIGASVDVAYLYLLACVLHPFQLLAFKHGATPERLERQCRVAEPRAEDAAAAQQRAARLVSTTAAALLGLLLRAPRWQEAVLADLGVPPERARSGGSVTLCPEALELFSAGLTTRVAAGTTATLTVPPAPPETSGFKVCLGLRFEPPVAFEAEPRVVASLLELRGLADLAKAALASATALFASVHVRQVCLDFPLLRLTLRLTWARSTARWLPERLRRLQRDFDVTVDLLDTSESWADLDAVHALAAATLGAYALNFQVEAAGAASAVPAECSCDAAPHPRLLDLSWLAKGPRESRRASG